jgi:uncharacterized membrane protein
MPGFPQILFAYVSFLTDSLRTHTSAFPHILFVYNLYTHSFCVHQLSHRFTRHTLHQLSDKFSLHASCISFTSGSRSMSQIP